MTIRDPELFHRALRAAAGVTGVLKRGAAIGVAAGALTLTGCGPSKTASAPSNAAGGGTGDPSAAASTDADAGVTTPDCEADPGYGSKCCTAEREANRSPIACTPWGPPAPPAYRGEALA